MPHDETWEVDESLLVKEKSLPELFPDVDFYLHRGVISNPPLCLFSQLSDGSLSIVDLHIMHEVLDLKQRLNQGKENE